MPRKKGTPKHNPFAMQDHQLTRGLTNVNVNQLSDVESDSSYDDIFTDFTREERVYLSDIVSDEEVWDDKLLSPDKERSKVFSKETGDFIRDELKKTQSIIAKQKRIENALKKIRTGTTSGPSCSSGINEPRSKRMRRATLRFEPEPDSIAVKRAMRETMPRKEYITSSSSSSSSTTAPCENLTDEEFLRCNETLEGNYLPPPKKFMIDDKAKSKNLPPPVPTPQKEALIKARKRKTQGSQRANDYGVVSAVDGRYYCLLCDEVPSGWSGPSGLWYHSKRFHNAETRPYCRRVPLKKKKYERQHSSSSKYYAEKQKKEKARKKRLTAWDIKKKKDEANLLLGFAEGAAIEEETKKAITKNAIINELQSLFRKFKNPDGANIFIELINNNSSYGEIIIKETKNYIEKISIRDKDKIKQYTMDFLQTLALIKRQHSREQLTIFEGFVFEESLDGKNWVDVDDTGVIDDDGNPIKIVASENKFGGRKSRKKRRKSRKKRRKIRKKTRKKRKRKGRKSRRRR